MFFALKNRGIFASAVKLVKVLTGPKYNGKYLHKLIREKLGYTRLNQTLTNIVIPAFDIKKLQPTIFSSYKVVLVFFVSSSSIFIQKKKRKEYERQ